MSWDQIPQAVEEIDAIAAARKARAGGAASSPVADAVLGPDPGPSFDGVLQGLHAWRVYEEHPQLVRAALLFVLGMAVVGVVLLSKELIS